MFCLCTKQGMVSGGLYSSLEHAQKRLLGSQMDPSTMWIEEHKGGLGYVDIGPMSKTFVRCIYT